MPDYGTLPPEINSGRMYSGPGSGPMIAAAAAWDVLAAGLESMARSFSAVISGLQGEGWSGAASDAMGGAVAPYVAWVTMAGELAEQAATQARAAAAAYETAFAATVPPVLVTANRAELANLLETNIFGQNTVAISQTEAAYAQMWAQDAAAMYGYAASSSAAATLSQFSEPPPATNASGQSAQSAVAAQAASTSAAGQSQSVLSELISAVPQQLQALATTGTSSSSASTAASALTPSSLLSAVSNFNTFTAPINLGDGISRTYTSAGSFGTGLFRSNLQSATAAAKAAGEAEAATGAVDTAVAHAPVLARLGEATTVGKLSAPVGWTTLNPAAATGVEPAWLSDAELEGGPAWQEVPVANMWNGLPATGTGRTSSLQGHPMVNNMLRVAARQFKMPRPSIGG